MTENDYIPAEACDLKKKVIHKLAESVANEVGFKPGDSFDGALEALGGTLKIKDFWDLEDTESGSILVHGDGVFDIYVSSFTSGLRDRFTVAHEIGHYILHFLWPRQQQGSKIIKMRATRYGNSREEWEANWFAAAFLMPEDAFKKAIQGSDIHAVAKEFVVSEKTARIRAETLGVCLNE